jgi:hypothetical protein
MGYLGSIPSAIENKKLAQNQKFTTFCWHALVFILFFGYSGALLDRSFLVRRFPALR